MNIQHIYFAQTFYSPYKSCIVFIVSVHNYKIEKSTLSFLIMDNIYSKFNLCFKYHGILCDICFFPSLWIIKLIVRKIQPCINHRGKITIAQTVENGNPTVEDFAYITAGLVTHSNTLVPFFYPATFVYYQSGHLSFRQNRIDASSYLVDQFKRIPIRFVIKC